MQSDEFSRSATSFIQFDGCRLVSVTIYPSLLRARILNTHPSLKSVFQVSFPNIVQPTIIENPESKEIEEDSDVTLKCRFVGTPYPFTRISWHKDDMALPSNATRILFDTFDGTLYLAKAEVNDAGNYSCVLKSEFFESVESKVAEIRVTRKYLSIAVNFYHFSTFWHLLRTKLIFEWTHCRSPKGRENRKCLR